MNTQSSNYQANVKTSIANNRVVSVQETAVLTLLSDGSISTCNMACENLLGCLPSGMTGQHITQLLPVLAKVKELKGKRAISFLRFLSRIGYRFDVAMMNGKHFPAELHFSEIKYNSQYYMQVLIYPVNNNVTNYQNLT
jgi:uncharacterized protein YmfQ (DUF2313 family)